MAPAVGNLNTDGLGSAKSSKIVLFDVTKNELYKVRRKENILASI